MRHPIGGFRKIFSQFSAITKVIVKEPGLSTENVGEIEQIVALAVLLTFLQCFNCEKLAAG